MTCTNAPSSTLRAATSGTSAARSPAQFLAVGVAVDVDGVRGGGAQHLVLFAAEGQAAAG